MRRATSRWGRGLALAACLLPAGRAHAQMVPATPVASPRPDSLKTPTPTFVADTARHVTVVAPSEPSDTVTRPLARRIGAAIVVFTLFTLLLYNVRSR